MRVMHEFLILKAKQSDEVDMPIYALVGQHAPSTVSMYYHIDAQNDQSVRAGQEKSLDIIQ